MSNSIGKVFVHGLIGGGMSRIQGGSFRDGFLGSAASAFVSWKGENFLKKIGVSSSPNMSAAQRIKKRSGVCGDWWYGFCDRGW